MLAMCLNVKMDFTPEGQARPVLFDFAFARKYSLVLPFFLLLSITEKATKLQRALFFGVRLKFYLTNYTHLNRTFIVLVLSCGKF